MFIEVLVLSINIDFVINDLTVFRSKNKMSKHAFNTVDLNQQLRQLSIFIAYCSCSTLYLSLTWRAQVDITLRSCYFSAVRKVH